MLVQNEKQRMCVDETNVFIAIAASIEGAEVNDVDSLMTDTGMEEYRVIRGISLLEAKGLVMWCAIGVPGNMRRYYRLTEKGRMLL